MTARDRGQNEDDSGGLLFRAMVEHSSEIVKVCEPDGTLRYANAAFHQIFGYEPGESAGMNVLDLVHPDDLERVAKDTERALIRGGEASHRTEYRFRCADGSWRRIEGVATYLLERPGVEGVLINARDITSRERADAALKESERRLKAVMRGAPVILFAVDTDGKLTLTDGKGLESIGSFPEANIGRPVSEVLADFPSVIGNIRRAMAGEEVSETIEYRGAVFDVGYSPMRSEDGDGIEGVIGVATDVTERHTLQKEFERRAFHDPLTSLPNRDLFMDRLEHALSKAERRGESMAVLYMDLDNLKEVNDSLGHEAGDTLLVAVAARLKECIRREDTCARLGGDEFAFLIEEAGAEKAAEVARRISEAFRRPLSGDSGEETTIIPSIGNAIFPRDGGTAREILRAADRAMYREKARGVSEED